MPYLFYLLCLLILIVPALPALTQGKAWQEQDAGTDASLRGICAVSENVAWASGTGGTVLRTVDGGKRWAKVNVPGAAALDFRDIQAFDERTAFVLSSGPGDKSRIYRTTDGGKTWRLQFTSTVGEAFYDGFAFRDRTHGVAMSDPVDGRFLLLTTEDGETWKPLHPATLPPALPKEAGFAASGTSIAVLGQNDVWFVTGGAVARVFHSSDCGRNWTVIPSPLASGKPSQGAFSVAIAPTGKGMVIGGDYEQAKVAGKNAAYSTDGGRTWTLAEKGPAGYRSAVAFLPGSSPLVWITVGTSGSEYSRDGGRTWLPLGTDDYNAVSFSDAGAGWAVGPRGRIGRFVNLP
jgi:photosystem II stability/assembly factor-like uncharacterized protein